MAGFRRLRRDCVSNLSNPSSGVSSGGASVSEIWSGLEPSVSSCRADLFRHSSTGLRRRVRPILVATTKTGSSFNLTGVHYAFPPPHAGDPAGHPATANSLVGLADDAADTVAA